MQEISKNFYAEEDFNLKKISNFFKLGGKGEEDKLMLTVEKICIFINTVDYIKETLMSIEDMIIDKLQEQSYKDQVNFESQEELATGSSPLISRHFERAHNWNQQCYSRSFGRHRQLQNAQNSVGKTG
jgi:hypothetical protein